MKRFFFSLILILLVFISGTSVYANSYGSYKDTANGVVRVVMFWDCEYTLSNGSKESEKECAWTSGTGFAVGKKGEPVTYFVTNRHVVEDDIGGTTETLETTDGKTYKVKYKYSGRYIILDDKGTKYPVDVVTQNDGGPDLAIIKLKSAIDSKEPCVLHPYSDSNSLKGSSVWALGFPGGQNVLLASDDQTESLNSSVTRMTISEGSFSAEIDGSVAIGGGTLIQTTAAINHGNSGGPLVDEKGGIIGVNTYGVEQYNGSNIQGINAAVSINEVVSLLDKFSISYRTTNSLSAGLTVSANYIIFGVVAVGTAVILFLLIFRRKPVRQTSSASQNKVSPAPKREIPVELSETRPYVPSVPVSPAGAENPVVTRTLVGIRGPLEDKRFAVKPNERVLIGRDPNQCSVVFPADAAGVSRVHCEILFSGEITTIRDLGSSYGTYVSGVKLNPNESVRLHRGHPIDIGSEKNRFALQ